MGTTGAFIHAVAAVCDTTFELVKMHCGGFMIGSAMFYPIAHEGGHHMVSTITLIILIPSAVAFHLVYPEPFVEVGIYTFLAAISFLIPAVIWAGPAKKDFIPWLPLFLIHTSLITIVAWEVTKAVRTWRSSTVPPTDPEGSSSLRVTNDYDSDDSFQTETFSRDRVAPLTSTRNDNTYFDLLGPSSNYSEETGSGRSKITLSSTGCFRSEWDRDSQTNQASRFFSLDERVNGVKVDQRALPSRLQHDLPNDVLGDLGHEGHLSREDSRGSDSPLLDGHAS